MDNDSKIPEGWAMPDNLAKKITEGLNRKTLRPEDELADALEEMARYIALIEPNPIDWARQAIYLLDRWRRKLRDEEVGLISILY